jgi:hypothetical protein
MLLFRLFRIMRNKSMEFYVLTESIAFYTKQDKLYSKDQGLIPLG